MSTRCPRTRAESLSTPGREDPASPANDETLRSYMGQSSHQPQSYRVNGEKVFVKVKVANGRQEDLDIIAVYKIAWSFLLGCQAKEAEETRSKELKRKLSTEFPANNQCLSSLWPAKMWKRNWTASPSGKKKKGWKPRTFSCLEISYVGNHKIPINVYRGPAFSRCTTGDLEGKLPIKAKRKIT